MPLKYNRYEPELVTMKTTPRLGEDASKDELIESRTIDMEKINIENVNTEPEPQ